MSKYSFFLVNFLFLCYLNGQHIYPIDGTIEEINERHRNCGSGLFKDCNPNIIGTWEYKSKYGVEVKIFDSNGYVHYGPGQPRLRATYYCRNNNIIICPDYEMKYIVKYISKDSLIIGLGSLRNSVLYKRSSKKYKLIQAKEIIKDYWPNGQLMSKGLAINGFKIGDWEYYHDNGQLRKKVVIHDGLEIGERKEYNSKGFLIDSGYVVEMLQYLGTRKMWYNDSSLRSISRFNGKYHYGEQIEYSDDGGLEKYEKYDNFGKPVGMKYQWYNLKLIRYFKEKEREDKWFLGNEIEDQVNEVDLAYYSYNHKKQLDGVFFVMNKNYRIVEQGNYSKDKKNGTWYKFDDNGRIIDKCYYQNDVKVISR